MNILSHFAAVMSLKNEENLSRMLKTLCDVIQFCLKEAEQPIRLGFWNAKQCIVIMPQLMSKIWGIFIYVLNVPVYWHLLCWGYVESCFVFPLYPYPMEREGQKFWMPFGQVISNYHRSISDIIIQPILVDLKQETSSWLQQIL